MSDPESSRDPLDRAAPKFPGYEILSELGSGSFGRVYKARKLSTGQLAAIKVIRSHPEDTETFLDRQRERFRREMYICAHLSHPHIVPLIDHSSESDPLLYAVFDYVSGDTLEHILEDEGALEPREALRLMSQVLDALACAHQRSVIHRDLKPANIVVTKTGARRNAMVLDFGLGGFAEARRGEEAARITRTREALGTPAYAAPEQLRGEPPTARCDLYSWGLIFVECLTGQRLVEGKTLEAVLQKQMGPEPVPIPESLATGPLGPLLASVTAKDPLRREHSAETLLASLESISVIDGLATDTMERAASDAAASGAPDLDGLAHLPREKRQITVMSCRIAVSDAGGSLLESEEHDRLLGLQLATCRNIVERRGGSVSSVSGTRTLAVFGYPRAQEDAAGRAARAALHIVEELQTSPVRPGADSGVQVEVHIGIHTGLEVVPAPRPALDVSGGLALGSTPDVASELDALAGPGEVLLSQASADLLRGDPGLRELGTRLIGSLGKSVSVFCVRSVGGVVAPSRDDAALIGRDHELRELEEIWAQTAAGSPQVLWIRGEAGIGKSRMLRELRRKVGAGAWIECRCSPDAQHSPLRPVIDALGIFFGSNRIEAVLGHYGLKLEISVPLLCSLLSIPMPPGYQEPPMGPEKRKELSFQCLLDLIFGIAEKQPLAFVVEDLHWADPTTRELLERLVDDTRAWELGGAGAPLRLGILVSSRTELEPWRPLRDVPLIQLSSLSRQDARDMVFALLAPGRKVAPAVVEDVVRRADGVPLFLEEVTRMMPDTPHAAGTESAGRAPFEIPGNLRDLMAARLDRLPHDVRETAQCAAVLGREFRTDVLEAVTTLAGSELRRHLDALAAEGLVYQRRGRLSNTCVFKHSLLRDAAYELVPGDRRCHTHEIVARALEEQFPEEAARSPELLAQHFQEAGQLRQAVRYWKDAGRLARRRWANAEASQHLLRGIELLQQFPDSAEDLREELRFQQWLGNSLMTLHGYASAQAGETFTRAVEISTELGDPDALFPALNGLWGFHLVRADPIQSRDLARRQSELAAQTGRPFHEMAALHATGTTAFFAGELPEARRILERALEAYEALPPEEWTRLTSSAQSPTSIPCYVAWCLLLSGHPDRAVRLLERTIEQARKRGNPYLMVEALTHGTAVWHDLSEPAKACGFADEVIALCVEHGFGLWRPVAEQVRGWARVLAGDRSGLQEIVDGAAAYRRTGSRTPLAYQTAYFVEALLAAQAIEDGIAKVDESLAEFEGNVDRFYDAELHRLKGELLRRAGKPEPAADCYRAARELAHRQGARWLELRACLSAARLAHDEGAGKSTTAELKAVVSRFSKGAETRDLREARELLAALRQ